MTQDAFNAFPGEGFTGNTQIDLARARKLATFLSRRSEYDTQELVDSARNRVAEIITRRRKEIRKLAQLVLKNRRVSPEEIGRVLGIELKVLDD
jgi:ATP-dependent Zn protease